MPCSMRWLASLLLLLSLISGNVFGLTRDLEVAELRRANWGVRDGAPLGVVSIAQTVDGYLWLANAQGLFRFDGLHFQPYALPRDAHVDSREIYTLLASPDGGVWIGFTYGGVAFLKDGKMSAYTEEDGLPRGSVLALAFDRDGALWAGTSSGLARLDGSRWRQAGAAEGYVDGKTDMMMLDSAGALWAISPQRIHVLAPGTTVFQAIPFSREDEDIGIAESPTGEVWAITPTRLHKLRKNDNPTGRVSADGIQGLFDKDGTLWSVAPGMIRRIARPEQMRDTTWKEAKEKWPSYSEVRIPMTGWGAGLREDREGNVWFASMTELWRFSEPRVARISQVESLGFNAYLSGFAPAEDGGLWVISSVLDPIRFEHGKFRLMDGIGMYTCAARTDEGEVWFGGERGLRRQTGDTVERIALPDEATTDVRGIAVARDGAVWVSLAGKGVFRRADGGWRLNGGVAGLPALTATTLSTDAMRRLWFAYPGGRVAVLDGEHVTLFSERRRLPVGNVTALYAKRSHVWAGGEFGLAVLDGDAFREIASSFPGAFANISGIVETSDGELWVNSSAGIVRVPAEEVHRALADPGHQPRLEVFRAADGVEGSSAQLRPFPTVVEGTDGRLWFLTNVGLYSADPKHIHRNLVPPPVRVKSVVVGNVDYEAPRTSIMLPKGTSTLQIRYVGLSLSMPEEVRYRYRLEGVDNDWRDGGTQREVLYTDLVPGTYRFTVTAANADGHWNEIGDAVELTIPPTFLQSRWFIALCVLGAGVVMWTVVRFRVRQVAARMHADYEVRIAERERIARELHDTLLQGTQALVYQFEAAADHLPRNDALRAQLDSALDASDAVLKEGRDRVLDLRVPDDPVGTLDDALSAAGEALRRGRTTSFASSVEGAPRDLYPAVREEIYRVGREALFNAFRHAQAARVELRVRFMRHGLSVVIRDDGRGFDAGEQESSSPGGHWGIQGMRERAASIGATLDVSSRPGAGSRVELCISATRAYQSAGGRLRTWLGLRATKRPSSAALVGDGRRG